MWHTPFQMRWKSLTLDHFEGQYCKRKCTGCSTFSLATAGLSCCYFFLFSVFNWSDFFRICGKALWVLKLESLWQPTVKISCYFDTIQRCDSLWRTDTLSHTHRCHYDSSDTLSIGVMCKNWHIIFTMGNVYTNFVFLCLFVSELAPCVWWRHSQAIPAEDGQCHVIMWFTLHLSLFSCWVTWAIYIVCCESYATIIPNKKFELMLTGRAKAYSSSCLQAVTHRSTNQARRRVTSFQPKRVTNDATPPMPTPWRHLVNDFVSQSKIARKIHKKSLFWRSRSSKVIEFSANWKPVYDFLLVINSNLGLISHRYWDTTSYRPKIANFAYPPFI